MNLDTVQQRSEKYVIGLIFQEFVFMCYIFKVPNMYRTKYKVNYFHHLVMVFILQLCGTLYFTLYKNDKKRFWHARFVMDHTNLIPIKLRYCFTISKWIWQTGIF